MWTTRKSPQRELESSNRKSTASGGKKEVGGRKMEGGERLPVGKRDHSTATLWRDITCAGGSGTTPAKKANKKKPEKKGVELTRRGKKGVELHVRMENVMGGGGGRKPSTWSWGANGSFTRRKTFPEAGVSAQDRKRSLRGGEEGYGQRSMKRGRPHDGIRG